MAGRSGRRRVDPGSPVVDLDAVFADDAFVDRIAARTWGAEPTPLTSGTAGRFAAGASRGSLLTVDHLTDLLTQWRQELAITPIPAPPRAVEVAPAVRQPQRKQSKKATLRPALAVAAAIAALLVGAASIGSKEAPRESALFALTEVLWPSRAASVASADKVDAILLEARSAIQDGRTQDAQLALLRATVELGTVDVVDGKGDMQEKVAAMWVEVAPLAGPTGIQPRPPTGALSPTTGLRTPAEIPMAVLAAQAGVAQSVAAESAAAQSVTAQSAAPAGAGQPTGAQLAAPQVQAAKPTQSQPSQAPTGAVQAALAPGWPSNTASTQSADPSLSGSAAPVVSGAPVVVAGNEPPVTTPAPSSEPATPPPPTAPVDPLLAVAAPDTPIATEQSPPAPTPSVPGQRVDSTNTVDAAPISSQDSAPDQLDTAAGTG